MMNSRNRSPLEERTTPRRDLEAFDVIYGEEKHDESPHARLMRRELLGSPTRCLVYNTPERKKKKNAKPDLNTPSLSFAPLEKGEVEAAMRTAKPIQRNKKPTLVLDAPLNGSIRGDYYSSAMDLSNDDVLALSLGNTVYAADMKTVGRNAVVVHASSIRNYYSVKHSSQRDLAMLSSKDIQIFGEKDFRCKRSLWVQNRDQYFSKALEWVSPSIIAYGQNYHLPTLADVRAKQHRTMTIHHHDCRVVAIKAHTDQRRIATTDNANRVCIWDLRMIRTGQVNGYTIHMPEYTFNHGAAVKAMDWHGSTLLTGSGHDGHSLTLWSTATGRMIQKMDAGAQVTSAFWSSDQSEIVTTHGHETENRVKLWNFRKGRISAKGTHSIPHYCRDVMACMNRSRNTLYVLNDFSRTGGCICIYKDVFQQKAKRSKREPKWHMTIR